ncbi:MAG: hypothetical protein WEC83_01385 [Patescibacteria group bacterium]
MISLAKAFADVKVAYKKQLGIWLLAGAIVSVLSAPGFFFNPAATVSILIGIISFLLLILMSPGLTSMALLSVRGKKPTLAELPDKAYLSLKMLGLFIIYGLMVALGTAALIIPGIYLAIRYWPAQYILVENGNIGVFEALIRSQKLTKGKILTLLGVLVVFIVIFIVPTIIPDILFNTDLAESSVWRLIIASLISTLLYAFMTVGGASVYKQLAGAKISAKK